MRELQVGDTLWLVEERRQPRQVRVEKIGRVWLTLSDGRRVDRRTLRPETSAFATSCFRTLEEYEEQTKLSRFWRLFRYALDYKPAPGVTAEDVRQAAAILRISLPEA